jgi:hypothetical protein
VTPVPAPVDPGDEPQSPRVGQPVAAPHPPALSPRVSERVFTPWRRRPQERDGVRQPLPVCHPFPPLPAPPPLCHYVEVEDLPCPVARPHEVLALAIQEVVTVSDAAEPDSVLTWIAPGYARVVFPGGEILLNVHQRTVTSWDGETQRWTVDWLEDWEFDAETEAREVLERYVDGTPKFARIGRETKVLDMKCDRHYVGAKRRTPEGDIERIRQDLWVTRDLETTEAIAQTYMALVPLVDRTWIEVPIERPRGIVLRSVTSRRPVDAGPGDVASTTTVRIESITHVIAPRTFFDLPVGVGYPVVWPTSAH